jgi:hypothetical protein
MALKKQDLINSLNKMGVELTGKETVDDLKKLIADNAEHLEEAPEGVPEPEEVEEHGEDVGSKTEVVVKYRDHQGEVTSRTFSKEVHGADFKKLAEEFKATNAARIVA